MLGVHRPSNRQTISTGHPLDDGTQNGKRRTRLKIRVVTGVVLVWVRYLQKRELVIINSNYCRTRNDDCKPVVSVTLEKIIITLREISGTNQEDLILVSEVNSSLVRGCPLRVICWRQKRERKRNGPQSLPFYMKLLPEDKVV